MEHKEIYLDNAATTACLPRAARIVAQVLTEDYGNPSSLHNKGFEGEKIVKHAREVIAKSLKCSEKELIFTSGGTESNNLALAGAAFANKRAGKHIITTMVEHPSVYQPVKALEDEGFEVTYLPVDGRGVISSEQLASSLRKDTILVSVMHVNNEIGSVQPVEEIASLIRSRAPGCLFHVDAIQSYGKLPLYPSRVGIDLLSVSGHKLHGPKGSGFLFAKEKTKLSPVLLGGGQENGLRSGTENTAAIAGLGVAVEEAFADLNGHAASMRARREQLMKGLGPIPGVSFNGPADETAAPHILSVSVEGVRSEVLLHALEDKGIFVSAGSACSSNRPSKSRTLMAIGLKDPLLESTIRFSFSRFTTPQEVEAAIAAMGELVPILNKFRRH